MSYINQTDYKVVLPQGAVSLPWTIPNPNANVDAFGRPRASSPHTFFNSDFEYDASPLWFVSSLVGTGTVAKTSGESSVLLSTGGTALGAGAVYQSKQYFRYEPGKARFIIHSGYIGAQKTGVTSRIGNFDTNNGVYFEMDGALGMSVNQRSNTSGSVVNTRVLQANWNIDKMDGTGSSGVTLDFSKTQLFWIDFQWMGTGHVRFGFFVNGSNVAVHEIYNNNVFTSPYTNTATLPVRWEIFNTTGGAASSTNIKCVCNSLVNEGSPELAPSYIRYTASNAKNSVAVDGTEVPILSISPRLAFMGLPNRVHNVMEQLAVACVGGNSAFYKLIYNGTLTGASFQNVDTNSNMTYDTAATSISGGIVVASGYATSAAQMISESLDKLKLPLTVNYDATVADVYSVVCTSVPNSTNATCTATLTSTAWNAVALELRTLPSGVASVGGAHNAESAGATTLTATYSPTAGNAAVVVFNTGAAVTALVVKDNLGNTLIAGPTSGTLAQFYQFPIPSGVTGYIATWTTARQASIAVQEYSGVVSVNTNPTPNTAGATSATASITSLMLSAADFLVVGFGDVASNTLTGTVGNQRQQTLGSATTAPIVLMDAVPAPGISNCSAKLSWIELR